MGSCFLGSASKAVVLSAPCVHVVVAGEESGGFFWFARVCRSLVSEI